jgi:hypothetical protein
MTHYEDAFRRTLYSEYKELYLCKYLCTLLPYHMYAVSATVLSENHQPQRNSTEVGN